MNQRIEDQANWYTQETLHEAARIISIKTAELQVLDQKQDVVQLFLDIINQLNQKAAANLQALSQPGIPLLAVLRDAQITEANLTELYNKMVGFLVDIPRQNSHSVGHDVTIYTHPDGHTISPGFPAYTIANGRDGHV